MRELRVEHSLAHSVCVYVCFRSHSHCYLFRVRISRTLLFSVNVQSRRNEMNLKHELNMKWCVVHWWIRDLCKIQFSQCMCMCWYIWMYVLWMVWIWRIGWGCAMAIWLSGSSFWKINNPKPFGNGQNQTRARPSLALIKSGRKQIIQCYFSCIVFCFRSFVSRSLCFSLARHDRHAFSVCRCVFFRLWFFVFGCHVKINSSTWQRDLYQ